MHHLATAGLGNCLCEWAKTAHKNMLLENVDSEWPTYKNVVLSRWVDRKNYGLKIRVYEHSEEAIVMLHWLVN